MKKKVLSATAILIFALAAILPLNKASAGKSYSYPSYYSHSSYSYYPSYGHTSYGYHAGKRVSSHVIIRQPQPVKRVMIYQPRYYYHNQPYVYQSYAHGGYPSYSSYQYSYNSYYGY